MAVLRDNRPNVSMQDGPSAINAVDAEVQAAQAEALFLPAPVSLVFRVPPALEAVRPSA